MARPAKNSADYFPHDAGMRNHKKIKAIRSKFGVTGYAIWSMLLELLTGNDGNVFEYSDMEFELIAGDFGVSVTEIRDTVDYCIKLELLFNVDGFVRSESLDERLAPVYLKRGKAKELSAKQRRVNGQFTGNNAESSGVSVTEIPQSKVKEIRVNENIKNDDVFISGQAAFEEIQSDEMMVESLVRSVHQLGFRAITAVEVMKAVRFFLTKEAAKPEFKRRPRDAIKSHLVNWIAQNASKIQSYG